MVRSPVSKSIVSCHSFEGQFITTLVRRAGSGGDLDKPGLRAATEDVVALLDVDRDGTLGLVEWTVQHALIQAFLSSRRHTRQ